MSFLVDLLISFLENLLISLLTSLLASLLTNLLIYYANAFVKSIRENYIIREICRCL